MRTKTPGSWIFVTVCIVIVALGGIGTVIDSIAAKETPDLHSHEANVARMAECLESAQKLCRDAFDGAFDSDVRDERLAIAIELYRTGR